MTKIPVPHLAVKNVAELENFERHLLSHQVEIEQWFRQKWQQTPAPFYASVDLRNAGFKLAPIDTNLFPAGFNNLNHDFDSLSIQAIQSYFQQHYSSCLKILLIPENHTRNQFYFENLGHLMRLLSLAGYQVRCGSWREDLVESQVIRLQNGQEFTIAPIRRKQDQLLLDDFKPCLILLNNDLSDGIPDLLKGIQQDIFPTPNLGWSSRKKSQHFGFYNEIATEFASLIDIDPWLINPYFDIADELDFSKRQGEEELAEKVNSILEKTQAKYREYQIEVQPFVIVKADAGTYGMGVLRINDAQEILELNRKQRNKMATTKGNQPISQVIIQEGVPSFEFVGEPPAIAEPVVYMISNYVVGGFYRVHKERGPNDVLNTPGMHFEPLAFANSCSTPDLNCHDPLAQANRFYAYGVVARLALAAAAMEMKSVS